MVVGVIVVVGLGGERKVVGWWQWRPREEGGCGRVVGWRRSREVV